MDKISGGTFPPKHKQWAACSHIFIDLCRYLKRIVGLQDQQYIGLRHFLQTGLMRNGGNSLQHSTLFQQLGELIANRIVHIPHTNEPKGQAGMIQCALAHQRVHCLKQRKRTPIAIHRTKMGELQRAWEIREGIVNYRMDRHLLSISIRDGHEFSLPLRVLLTKMNSEFLSVQDHTARCLTHCPFEPRGSPMQERGREQLMSANPRVSKISHERHRPLLCKPLSHQQACPGTSGCQDHVRTFGRTPPHHCPHSWFIPPTLRVGETQPGIKYEPLRRDERRLPLACTGIQSGTPSPDSLRQNRSGLEGKHPFEPIPIGQQAPKEVAVLHSNDINLSWNSLQQIRIRGLRRKSRCMIRRQHARYPAIGRKMPAEIERPHRSGCCDGREIIRNHENLSHSYSLLTPSLRMTTDAIDKLPSTCDQEQSS
jgi:hypothetical protein